MGSKGEDFSIPKVGHVNDGTNNAASNEVLNAWSTGDSSRQPTETPEQRATRVLTASQQISDHLDTGNQILANPADYSHDDIRNHIAQSDQHIAMLSGSLNRIQAALRGHTSQMQAEDTGGLHPVTISLET